MVINEGDDVVTDSQITISSLPNSVLTSIMECVVRCSNPGQVIKVAMVCRSLYEAVVRAEGLWEQLSISHGWSRASAGPRTDVPSRSSPLPLPLPLPTSALAVRGEGDLHWFQYYTRRMTCRRNVRRFFRLYAAFLSRPNSMALMPGADPSALSHGEQRLGVDLPWELWELLRHRDGQAPGGAGVAFADDMRLLGVNELVLERHPDLPQVRQRLVSMGRSPGGGCQMKRPPGQQEEEEEEEEGALGGDDRVLVVASNPSSSRRLLVALDGQVYLARGTLSLAFFAPNVAAMIQKLLH